MDTPIYRMSVRRIARPDSPDERWEVTVFQCYSRKDHDTYRYVFAVGKTMKRAVRMARFWVRVHQLRDRKVNWYD